MKSKKAFTGTVIPMVTPVTRAGAVDPAAARNVVEHLVSAGASPFVLGTTGESASVPPAQRTGLVRTMVEQAAGTCKTYAGISSNCLAESIEAGRMFPDMGVDCLVANLPSYYPLNADHMLTWYERLADAVAGPLMLYNITITTHMSIPLEVIEKLSHHPNIVGLKDSERNEPRLEESLKLWKDRPDFSYFMGCAALSAKAMQLGADGIVPGGGNFIPGMYVDLYKAGAAGDVQKAQKLQEDTDNIAKVFQGKRILSESLAALKAIMSELELCGPAMLPPMLEASEEEKAAIRAELKSAGLLKA